MLPEEEIAGAIVFYPGLSQLYLGALALKMDDLGRR